MKLTKQQHKLHEEAMALLELLDVHTARIECKSCDGSSAGPDGLDCDDCNGHGTKSAAEFVYEHYHPGATNNLTKGAIFFTPPQMARDLATMDGGQGRIVDACAGIGMLAYYHYQHTFHWNPPKPQYVCIENNREFYEIGRKLLPQAEWHLGDVFDILPTLGIFDSGLSNPPYGNIASCKTKNFPSHAHLGVMELLLKHCRQGATVIVPRGCHEIGGTKEQYRSESYERFLEIYPGAMLTACSLDMDHYESFKATGTKVTVCDLGTPNMDGNPYLITEEPRAGTVSTTQKEQLELSCV